MENKIYDVIIIGAGPAGMTSAIYTARAGKSVILFEKDCYGGNITKSPKVENIPGFKSGRGVEFADNMLEQVNNLSNIDFCYQEAILISYNHGLFKVSLDNKAVVCGLSVIIATGTKHKELKLDTPDIYYCSVCDGHFFKDKEVMVYGSGNTAAAYALDLATYCKTVHLCDITPNMNCERLTQYKIATTKNIIWHPSTHITVVKNNKEGRLSSVKISTSTASIKCKAIFAAIGVTPQTDLLKGWVNFDEAGYIISDDCKIDKIPGLFVAGDCRTKLFRQVTTAVSDGTIAALEAVKYLNNLKK